MNPIILSIGGLIIIIAGWEADSPASMAVGTALTVLAAAIKWH